MSFRLIAEVLALDLPLGPKLTLVVLASHADEEGVCFPSMARLQRMTGQSESTVRRSLATLREAGVLELVTTGGGRGRPGVYRVTPGNGVSLEPFESGKGVTVEPIPPGKGVSQTPYEPEKGVPVTPYPAERVSRGRERVSNGPVKGVTVTPQSIREPVIEPVRQRPRNPLFDAIVETWQVNPADLTERQQKRVAVAAAQLHKVGATPEEIGTRGRIYRALPWNRDCRPPSPDALVSHWAECVPAALEQVDRKSLDRELQQQTMDSQLRAVMEGR